MPLTDLSVDSRSLELGRLARLRQALAATDHAGAVFFDPTNVRYATGTSNMQVYGLHSACRYVFVPTDGPVILFEFASCEHIAVGHPEPSSRTASVEGGPCREAAWRPQFER